MSVWVLPGNLYTHVFMKMANWKGNLWKRKGGNEILAFNNLFIWIKIWSEFLEIVFIVKESKSKIHIYFSQKLGSKLRN